MHITQRTIDYWKSEEQKSFQGWNFSYLDSRWDSDPLPWDYKELILKNKKMNDHLLDMGTGGGEFLLTLEHPYHLTYITESYPPNVKKCQDTLSPSGICVKQSYDGQPIPYENNTFNLVINRHEEFDPREIFRILKPGGKFITQQVGGQNNVDLSKRLLPQFEARFPSHTLENNLATLESAGMKIECSYEAFPRLRFFDVGALVYFAKIIEWEFPDFSVDACLHTLINFQDEITANGYLESTEHRFLIMANKPVENI